MSPVLQWNEAFLQGVRDSKLGPPMVARALAIAHTCIYDAWAAYDHKAVGTRLGGSLRRPRESALLQTKGGDQLRRLPGGGRPVPRAAVSSVFDPLMRSLGYDPGDLSTDTPTPTGIGNVAARAVLDFRHRDGANQLGDEPGGIAGRPLLRLHGLRAGERPDGHPRCRSTRRPFTTRTSWQPLRYVDGSGELVTPGFVGAQWQHVTTFALTSRLAALRRDRPGQVRIAPSTSRRLRR